ncbi:DUF4291 domain-containing protein [Methylovulum psychrotolerans]|jgi:hypothetical protein|uniref:DUF4291 domain-containing protein n=1 Tax=Methylovulum psychrotolerans TaxID=1704499 RepID=A0A1Z4C2C1_9GAMM|nr:DUF4291 domain-containing protein [Methylovulum psychrotolerans]ASF47671.1 hypothetical protein CEK71_17240 [Methylovulum psychrotolerans]MBT9096719.1 DUF4291 domain-containing protein [Methylovulum psychrotolerans]POZ51928.1 hypothetical protein AADEFJLK_02148 [Methylovulum psychrotolerans]
MTLTETLQTDNGLKLIPAIPLRQIRAVYDEQTIRVYQAYSDSIADAALAQGTFAPPFKMTRMTWIKPSFLWMMYRAGWGFKDPSQARILAIDISRAGFAWALANSCPSHPDQPLNQETWQHLKQAKPVRIQWDPERDLQLNPLPHRSIQIGLGGIAVDLYVNQWLQNITDITPQAQAIFALVQQGEVAKAQAMLPSELPYPFTECIPLGDKT